MLNGPKAVSLFSSAGIGDLGLVANGVEVIASSELVPKRHALYQTNFPSTDCFTGDIWDHKDDLIHSVRQRLGGEELFLVLATPPCQGMSTNGVGKLLAEIRAGNRPVMDERNRLIIPTMEAVTALKPQWLVLENVPAMKDTVILDRAGNPTNIIDYIKKEIGPDYIGGSEVISCSDYGIPQVRKRLITIFTRDPNGINYFRQNKNSFFPLDEREKPVTLREAIGHLPALDPLNGPFSRSDVHPLHYVQKMGIEKHWWLKHTPEGDTAFNNQCESRNCGYASNPTHVDRTVVERESSVHRTAIFCEMCGSLLPRPSILDKQTGERRLINGFHSAYRRMRWDEPAHTLTRNFPFEASDNKVHPEQHRPLSIYEAMIVQTIADYNFSFEFDGVWSGRKLIADIIGESVPPKLIDLVARKLLTNSVSRVPAAAKSTPYRAA